MRYAKLHRIAIRFALGVAALGGVSVANAYVFPSPPPGFAGTPGNWTYATQSADDVIGRIIHQSKALTVQVPGKPVTMPVSYRLAQNAPRIAAAAIFANPYVRVGVGVASWLGLAGLVWDAVNKTWYVPDMAASGTVSDGYYYSYDGLSGKYGSAAEACQAYSAFKGGQFLGIGGEYGPYCVYKGGDGRPQATGEPNKVKDQACPAGWYRTPAGCSSTAPPKTVNEKEFKDLLSPKPMPETVPKELPYPTPLPVEPSPGPWVNPEPGTNPQHRPMFVPSGDPVPNPNYKPEIGPTPENQPFIQPGQKITPSPTVNDPFRLDVKPVDRPKEDKNPMPGPESDKVEKPNDKPKEDTADLCEKHPDILACAKPELDTPEEEIKKDTRNISYQPESLFGGGACPADKTMTIGGHTMTVWNWTENCGYIQNYMRPVILVLCAFGAFVIVSGGTRQ